MATKNASTRPRASMDGISRPTEAALDDALVFSYCVRAAIRDPESMPREAFLSLLEKVWRQAGFELTSFTRDFLKYPPTRVVLLPTLMDDGSTKLERRVVNKGINREPLDLHRLFCEVWKLDGFRSVTDSKKWPLVAIACNFLKIARLSVARIATGERLNPNELRIVAHTKNTYERYLLQFEVRMTNARRFLATQGRRGIHRSCYNSHANRNSVDSKQGTEVSPGSISGSSTVHPQPHVVYAYIESGNISKGGVNGHRGYRNAIGGCGATRVRGQEGEPTQDIIVQQSALTQGCQAREPFDQSIGDTVIQPPGFLQECSSAVQSATLRGNERHECLKEVDRANEPDLLEKPDGPLVDVNFSNFAWLDQFKNDIANPSSSRNSKIKENRNSMSPAWYWAAEAQRADIYSSKAIRLDDSIETPCERHGEHIVPEAYWAAEGHRLGIHPVQPGHGQAPTRGLRGFVKSKDRRERNDSSLWKIGHRLRERLVKIKAVPTGGAPQRPIVRRIFRRKATSDDPGSSRPEMPATGHDVAGLTEADSGIQGSRQLGSYLAANKNGKKHEMTYRAKVERYE